MIPAPFDYHSPQTLAEAVALLASHRDDAKVLSGGQSLLPLLKLRLGAAGHLVDIGRIPGLEYIRRRTGTYSSAAAPASRPWSAALDEAAQRAAAAASPSPDRRGSVEYKREMARVLTARALRRAIQSARGGN